MLYSKKFRLLGKFSNSAFQTKTSSQKQRGNPSGNIVHFSHSRIPDKLKNVRGIRNNNPLNIEFNTRNQWEGQVGSDGRFVIFADSRYGFRAAARVLRNYQKRGITNINDIVHTFAPSHENNS